MFFFLKHKNNQRQVKHNLEHDALIESWVNSCIRMHHKAAYSLQAISEKLSLSTKRVIVIAFCFISFSSCIYLVIKSFFKSSSVNLSIAAIKVHEHVVQIEKRHITLAKRVYKNEFRKIKKFRAYIDSLAISNSGRRIYDSIRKNRPRLLDSLAIIENLYELQSSKK